MSSNRESLLEVKITQKIQRPTLTEEFLGLTLFKPKCQLDNFQLTNIHCSGDGTGSSVIVISLRNKNFCYCLTLFSDWIVFLLAFYNSLSRCLTWSSIRLRSKTQQGSRRVDQRLIFSINHDRQPFWRRINQLRFGHFGDASDCSWGLRYRERESRQKVTHYCLIQYPNIRALCQNNSFCIEFKQYCIWCHDWDMIFDNSNQNDLIL